jgi:hypothetical protein
VSMPRGRAPLFRKVRNEQILTQRPRCLIKDLHPVPLAPWLVISTVS